MIDDLKEEMIDDLKEEIRHVLTPTTIIAVIALVLAVIALVRTFP